MTNSPENPFVFGPPIEDRRLFAGRKDELRAVISQMENNQPTSVNIVGKRRVGKTSLLYHLRQTWPDRVREPNRFVLIYLSMQQHGINRKRNFYTIIAQEFLSQQAVSARPALADALRKRPMDGSAFADAMKAFDAKSLVPVLCLDEFEGLFKHPDEFDDDFYNGMRSMMNESPIMIVAATTKPIIRLIRECKLSSSFFNNAHIENLGELDKEGAKELLTLPPGNECRLSPSEQKLAREWVGSNHPFFLQMAAHALCEARRFNNDEKWARQRFDGQAKEHDLWGFRRGGLCLRCLRMLFWKMPVRVGALVRRTGTKVDNITNGIMGMFIIIIIALILMGIIKPDGVMALFKKVVGFFRSIGT